MYLSIQNCHCSLYFIFIIILITTSIRIKEQYITVFSCIKHALGDVHTFLENLTVLWKIKERKILNFYTGIFNKCIISLLLY